MRHIALVFYVKRQSIDIYFLSSQTLKTITFSVEVIRHQEILNKKLFSELLKPVLAHQNKKKAVVILSNDVVYDKLLSKQQSEEDISPLLQDFFYAVPFESSNTAVKNVITAAGAHLIATNRQLFEAIIDVCNQASIVLQAVCPSLLLQPTPTQMLSFAGIKSMLKQDKMIAQSNFLVDTLTMPGYIQADADALSDGDDADTPHTMSKKKQYLLLAFSLLFLLGSLVFAVFQLGFVPIHTTTSPKVKLSPTSAVISPTSFKINETTESSSSAKIATTSATILYDTPITILNGSGIAGQAQQVSDLLSSAGFTDITTGNADETLTTTVLIYTDTVDTPTRTALTKVLETFFSHVVTQEATTSAATPITITTGSDVK